MVWMAAMEESHVLPKFDLKSINIPEDVKMCHVVDVWKQAVDQLWQNNN